jgi:ribosomal-protein-alanine N-acetyltransferase
MTAELRTKRLSLRPLQLADAERTQRLFPQWEIVRFLNSKVPWPYPADRVLNVYRDEIIPGIEHGEEWHWTLRLKDTPDQHIGVISLHRDDWDNRGYWLGLPWHRQGLMTEAVVAVHGYWFDVLGFPVLRAPKAILNVALRRISEKTGMRVVATVERDYVSGRFFCGNLGNYGRGMAREESEVMRRYACHRASADVKHHCGESPQQRNDFIGSR